MNKIYLDFVEFSKNIRSSFKNNDYKYNIEYGNKIPILKISNKDNELYFKFNEFKTMDIINEYINLIFYGNMMIDRRDYYVDDYEILEYLDTAESRYKIVETGEFRRPKWQEYYLNDKGKVLLMSYEFEEYNSKSYKIIKIEEK